jgi:hypothetical protein
VIAPIAFIVPGQVSGSTPFNREAASRTRAGLTKGGSIEHAG